MIRYKAPVASLEMPHCLSLGKNRNIIRNPRIFRGLGTLKRKQTINIWHGNNPIFGHLTC